MNIFYSSDYATEATLPTDVTFNSISSNTINIPNSVAGDLLYINANKDITGLAIGPQNYVLQSSGTEPQWTNTLNINTVQTNALRINNTFLNDMYCTDSNNNLLRIPIGNDGDILKYGGGTIGWGELVLPDPLTLNDLNVANSLKLTNQVNGPAFIRSNQVVSSPVQYWFIPGTGGNVPSSDTQIFSINSTCVQGRNYKIEISGSFISTVPASLGFPPPHFLSNQITQANTGPHTIFRYFNSPINNPSFQFNGFTGVPTTGSFINISVLITEL